MNRALHCRQGLILGGVRGLRLPPVVVRAFVGDANSVVASGSQATALCA